VAGDAAAGQSLLRTGEFDLVILETSGIGQADTEIVDYSDRFNGYLALDDFHGFEAQIVEPISIAWNDELTVYQNPPNSQGIAMLIALNILKGFDFSGQDPDSPDVIHRQTEATKLAFADRNLYAADPDFVDPPAGSWHSRGPGSRWEEKAAAAVWSPLPPAGSQIRSGTRP
jgi:gamma-glutamyltranspeptidase